MRSTIKTSSNTALMNILNNYSRLLQVQNQMASGRRVNAPSDDPLSTNAAMRYDTILAQTEQFNSNIVIGDSFLGLSESALADVDDILISAKSLVIGSANDTTTEEMQYSNAVEMSSLLDELMTIANRQEGSRYLFGGTETTEAPFEVVSSKYVYYAGNDEDVNLQVDYGNYMAVNVTGADAFGQLESTISSSDLTARLNISPNTSTRLEDLNGGDGVSSGSILVNYTSSPFGGLAIDLSSADTVEDVADLIEQASIAQADTFDVADPEYNYTLKVELNAEQDGLQIVQWNRSTNMAVDFGTDPTAVAIEIEDTGSNTTARDLGIRGAGSTTGTSVLVGNDTDPAITENTLLADLAGYENVALMISNGDKSGSISISDVDDTQDTLSGWNLTGLTADKNCSEDGELYSQITDLGSGSYRIDIYSGPEMLSNQLVATGEGDSGTVILDSANSSGVSGSVSLNPAAVPGGGTLDIELKAEFPATFSATIEVPAFVETGVATADPDFSTSDFASGWEIHGLETGVNTDADGNLYTQYEDMGGGVYEVRLYRDAAHTDLVASGQLSSGSKQGAVELTGATGYEEVTGQVQIEWPAAAVTATIGSGPFDMTLTATGNDIGDLLNEINNSGIYVNAEINDDGDGIDISSRLSGAYLTVAQSVTAAAQMGDEMDQLSQLNLNGIAAGVNADVEGSIYAEIVDDSGAGTGPYTVNFYSDSQHTELVASASATSASGIVTITEENGSGLSGSVYLEYSADDSSIEITAKSPTVSNDEANQISEVDLSGLTSGVNCDYRGNVYVEVEDVAGTIEVRVYSDSNKTQLVAQGTTVGSGLVTLAEQNGSGLSGSLYLNYSQDDSDIVIEQSNSDMTGQVREENVFSCFADAIDAMNAGDTESLSGLIDDFESALDTVLLARADVGARQQRLELLTSRHEDEITNFTGLKSDEIDLDFASAITQYQQETNTYEAALRISAQIIPMSLVDFI